MHSEALRRLAKARFKLMRDYPHFSYLVGHLDLRENENIGTIAVDVKGRCYYSPSFISSLSAEEVEGVLVHEVLHLALEHNRRADGRTARVRGGSVWNISTDLFINALIQESKGFGVDLLLPKNGLIPKDGEFNLFGMQIVDIPKRSADSIYDEIVRKLKEEDEDEDESSSSSEDGSSDNGSPKGFDEHVFADPNNPLNKEDGEKNLANKREKGKLAPSSSSSPSSSSKEDEEEENEGGGASGDSSSESSPENGKEETSSSPKDWSKILAEAIVIAKMTGNLSAGLERMFEELHHSKTNWKVKLRQMVKTKIPFDYSYRKPNRNYLASNLILPSMDGEKYEIVFAIDTSGSITNNELSDFLGEIDYIARSLKKVNVTILTHDVDVHEVYEDIDPKKIGSIRITGGGGTSHIPVIERIGKLRKKAALAVFLTDGFSNFPERAPSFRTIFVLSDSRGRQNLPPWAKEVVLLHP